MDQRALVGRLLDPRCYPHPVEKVDLLETHISYVLLAGEFAYKIKKALALPFLDYSTLELRRRYCEEELRINRRTAPALYLEVVPIRDCASGPCVGTAGDPAEYAVRMRRFRQTDLFDAMARRNELGPVHVVELARHVARFHADADAAPAGSLWGASATVFDQALDNVSSLRERCADVHESNDLGELEAWTRAEFGRISPMLERRRAAGLVRECHGDLHLGNIAWIDGAPVAFDAIEFEPALRWIDVASEIAFVVMDLLDHGLPALAWRFLDEYLAVTGDYEAVVPLRFFLVYRALVRAKVAAIRSGQQEAGGAMPREVRGHLDLARDLARSAGTGVVAMHGLSGSGKSTFALRLAESLGAVRVRSDVERKRLAGVPPDASTQGVPGVYSADFTGRVYDRLEALARLVAGEGRWPVVVDAASLLRAERDRFRMLAGALALPFCVVSCEAGEEELRRRIEARRQDAGNVSEATTSVLADQMRWQEPLLEGEQDVIRVGPDDGLDACIAKVATRMEGRSARP